jgi:hypothetical protein
MTSRRATDHDSLLLQTALSLRSISVPRFAVRRDEAAAAFGISETTWDHWVAIGRMPPGRKIDGVRLWDVGEIFRAWVLLRDQDVISDANPFDQVTA